ncbi:hypothetical protein F889_00479 [Acinetobacter colistiniresistens]|uniref:Uncharacterized protein n=1 Tax=Acinetobacter colistiniresistens TaxID=280145 RepID=N9RB08_9GAMM|nr:hypothetical protein [Acinetobacter colistiniresistens]ENX36317.1 hypothetical protein F889_00479 [Acinetobacter colistiniresistens]
MNAIKFIQEFDIEKAREVVRSEFEKNRYWIGLFKTDVEFNGSLGEFGRYELNGSRDVNHSYLEAFNGKWEAYAKAWQHRQTEVDELKKQNAWLSDVAERENKRANNLQQDKTSTTISLGKTIQEKNELQKRVDAVVMEIEKLHLSGVIGFGTVKKLEQALKCVKLEDE